MTTYKSAGVNIEAGDELVENSIKALAKSTIKPGVLSSIGGFGSVFDIKKLNMKDPLLITTTDGVGTKLLLAIQSNRYNWVGFDLVAMCVNDLVATGATPKLFLDYYATGKLDKVVAEQIIRSIALACSYSKCSLVGGETAEMPGLYKTGDLDLAGFAAGFVERDDLLPKQLTTGDTIIGLPSSGIHSNGFSLVRSIIKKQKIDLNQRCPWDTRISLSDALLTPTRIYVDDVLNVQKLGILKAAAHITGGGFVSNLKRVIDDEHCAVITEAWDVPPVFKWLKRIGDVSNSEMLKVFNCGIGMVLIVSDKDKAMTILNALKLNPHVIGRVEDKVSEKKVVMVNLIEVCL